MANILIVDASPLIYSNWNALGKKFSTPEGELTGLRFGFLRSIRSYAEKTRADRVAICYDTPEPVKKAALVDDYKANREFTPDKAEMYAAVPALKRLLSYTRYAQCEAPGYEADDIVGHLARKFAAGGHDVYVVSSDNDLCQLLDDRIKIWMPPKKESKNKPWFKDERFVLTTYGVLPCQLTFWRALWGDDSDNILPAISVAKSQAWTKESVRNQLAAEIRQLFTKMDVLDLPEVMKIVRQRLAGMATVDEVRFAQNFEVTRLHDPDNLVITKGEKSVTKLRAELDRLAIRSMIPHISSLTGVDIPGLPVEEA